MPQKTKIEWCRTYYPDGTYRPGYSSNPIFAINRTTGKRGHFCTKYSSGCAHCYSEVINKRFGNGLSYSKANESKIEFKLNHKELDALLKIKKPSKIFLGDMTDLFHELIPFEYIDEIIYTIRKNEQHVHQILTKRIDRMSYYFAMNAEQGIPDNLWLGVSIENQKEANRRIPKLLQIPVKVRFLSCEPLLESIDLVEALDVCITLNDEIEIPAVSPSDYLQWVIAGSESGNHARLHNLDWFHSLRDQCKDAEIPFFMKQITTTKGTKIPFEEWPEDLQIREFPKEGV